MEHKLILDHCIKQIKSDYQLALQQNHRMMLVIFGNECEKHLQSLFLEKSELSFTV